MDILRKVRKERGLTLDEVAAAVGVTTSYISQIERGLKTPSLEILRSLSKYLNISITRLLEPSAQVSDTCKCVVTPKEKRSTVHFAPERSNVLIQSLLPDRGSQGTHIYHITLAPGECASGTQTTHPYPEIIFVLSGTIEVQIENERYLAECESSVYVAPMVPHDYCNIGSQKATVIAILVD